MNECELRNQKMTHLLSTHSFAIIGKICAKIVCKGCVCICVSSYRKSNMTTVSEVTTREVNKAIAKEKIR